jgi:8-oxo-dGTP diphosphatase
MKREEHSGARHEMSRVENLPETIINMKELLHIMEEQKRKVGVGFGVMILKKNKILLGKRHEDPEKASSLLNGAGTWTMPGGKLHFGETFEEGAKRETMEETGIQLKNVDVICVNNDMVENAHFITIGLFSDDFEGKPQVLEPDEITEWRWFDLNELPNPIYFPSTKVLENYKAKKFYVSQ